MKEKIRKKIQSLPQLFLDKKKIYATIFFIVCILIIAICLIAINFKIPDIIKNNASSSSTPGGGDGGSNTAKPAGPTTKITKPEIFKVKFDPLSITSILKGGRDAIMLVVAFGSIAAFFTIIGIILISIFVGKKWKNISQSSKKRNMVWVSIAFISLSFVLSIVAVIYGTLYKIAALNDFLRLRNVFSKSFTDILTKAGNAYTEKYNEVIKIDTPEVAKSEGTAAVGIVLGSEFSKLNDEFLRPELIKFIKKYGVRAGMEVSSMLDLTLWIMKDILTVDSSNAIGVAIPEVNGTSKADVIDFINQAASLLKEKAMLTSNDVFANNSQIFEAVLDKEKIIISSIWNQLYF